MNTFDNKNPILNKKNFLKTIRKPPVAEYPTLSDVPQIIDRFALTGQFWDNIRDHEYPYENDYYINFTKPDGTSHNIIENYLPRTPGKYFY